MVVFEVGFELCKGTVFFLFDIRIIPPGGREGDAVDGEHEVFEWFEVNGCTANGHGTDGFAVIAIFEGEKTCALGLADVLPVLVGKF